MEKGTFGVRRWLYKVMFEGVIFSGVFGGGELGCFRFQRGGPDFLRTCWHKGSGWPRCQMPIWPSGVYVRI